MGETHGGLCGKLEGEELRKKEEKLMGNEFHHGLSLHVEKTRSFWLLWVKALRLCIWTGHRSEALVAMPKRYYDDYSDMYLKNNSTTARKQHMSGRRHINNKVEYWQRLIREKGLTPPIYPPPPGMVLPMPKLAAAQTPLAKLAAVPGMGLPGLGLPGMMPGLGLPPTLPGLAMPKAAGVPGVPAITG